VEQFELLRMQLVGPAAGLTLVAAVAMLFWLVMLLAFVSSARNFYRPVYYWNGGRGVWYEDQIGTDLIVIIPAFLLVLAASSTILIGVRRLLRMERYGFVIFAILLAMIPWSPAVLVGLPVGLYTLVQMGRPEIKLAFVRWSLRRAGVAGAGRLGREAPMPLEEVGQRGALRSMLGGIGSLFFGSRVPPPPRPTTVWTPGESE
jgi:hypothetical protein